MVTLVNTTYKQRKILEELKEKILSDNTMGITPTDLVKIITTNKIKEIKKILNKYLKHEKLKCAIKNNLPKKRLMPL